MDFMVWKRKRGKQMTEQNKTDKIISELKKENDALRFVVAKLEKESKEWNLRLQDPEPIQVLAANAANLEAWRASVGWDSYYKKEENK